MIYVNAGTDKKGTLTKEILKAGNPKISAQVFTFRELATATSNFRAECLLGEGGFGRVYKGHINNQVSQSPSLCIICVFQGDLLNFILLSHCVQDVAVKQLDRNGVQGNREFLAEVLMLSLVHHPNLVNLMGYCAEGDQRILVYEYMPKGSLENLLFGKLKLN